MKDFEKSGYDDPIQLNGLKAKAINKFTTESNNTLRDQGDTLVFPIHYFKGISEFKKFVHSLRSKIQKPNWRNTCNAGYEKKTVR